MKKSILFLVTVFSFVFVACRETKTVTVKSSLVDCEGVGNQKCMQYKEKGSDNWQLFYGEIEGFTYEEGYTYELEVEVEKVNNPPADGSSLKYTLKKMISKKKDELLVAKTSNEQLANSALAKEQDIMPLVEYDSHTRGVYYNLMVYNGGYITISKQRNARPLRNKVSSKDMDELKVLIAKIKVADIGQLKSPTNKRQYDGAPFTSVTIYKGKEKFKSSSFDGGYPPAELEQLVNKMLSLADKK